MRPADEEFVEAAQRAEGEVDGGAAEFPLAEVAEEIAEVIAFQARPRWLCLPIPLVPTAEFGERFGVVAVGVVGRAPVRGEVGEELRAPRVNGLLNRIRCAHAGSVVAVGARCQWRLHDAGSARP